MRCVIARFICVAVSRGFVVARLFVRSVSRIVSLRDLFAEWFYALCRCEAFRAERLTHCVIARFICKTVSGIVSLRDFFCVAISRSLSLRDLFAKRSYDFCHCKIFLRSDLMRCVVARFFYIPF